MPFIQEKKNNIAKCSGCAEHCDLGTVQWPNHSDRYFPTVAGQMIRNYTNGIGEVCKCNERASVLGYSYPRQAFNKAQEIVRYCDNYNIKNLKTNNHIVRAQKKQNTPAIADKQQHKKEELTDAKIYELFGDNVKTGAMLCYNFDSDTWMPQTFNNTDMRRRTWDFMHLYMFKESLEKMPEFQDVEMVASVIMRVQTGRLAYNGPRFLLYPAADNKGQSVIGTVVLRNKRNGNILHVPGKWVTVEDYWLTDYDMQYPKLDVAEGASDFAKQGQDKEMQTMLAKIYGRQK
ncbi:MAG: hypothetical protein E7011_04835 [Alphaproteobacteria bacterium]|nr:hypothetical protein [Alphaproteobacteria bacterium]